MTTSSTSTDPDHFSLVDRLRRTLSRSLAAGLNSSITTNQIRSSSKDDDRFLPNSERILADTFRGDVGFGHLRKIIRKNSDAFRDLIAIFNERSDLESVYAKSLHKLSVRLNHIFDESPGAIEKGWKNVADSFACEAKIHSNLSDSFFEDIVQPLRSVYTAQWKVIRATEEMVEKSTGIIHENRTAQQKAKRRSHGLSKELEKTERRYNQDYGRVGKNVNKLNKLLSKRTKLTNQVVDSEKDYIQSAVKAEKQRSNGEICTLQAVDRLEVIEQQRLAHYQTALGRYQRKMTQIGPNLVQMYERHMSPLDQVLALDIRSDLHLLCSHSPSFIQPIKTLFMCDFFVSLN